MSTRPCEGGCGRSISAFGGRLFCVGCSERRDSKRKAERRREVREALARGEKPPPPKRAPQETKRCAACNAEFTSHVARRRYCSKQCGENHRYRTGERVNAPREREPRSSKGIGPDTPLIQTDWEGIRRRAISDARDGLSSLELRERGVPEHIVREAVKVASLERQRTGATFYNIPFGPPA